MNERFTVSSIHYSARRPIRDRFREILISDSVRNFVWLYYAVFIIGSLDLTFYSYPINLIVQPMGILWYDVWAWAPLVAAPVALLGLYLRHGGSPADQIHGNLLRRDFAGLWLQVGGHTAMTVVLGVFIGTAFYGRAPHQPIPSAYWLIAYFLGVAFLAVQCWYKVQLGRRKRKP